MGESTRARLAVALMVTGVVLLVAAGWLVFGLAGSMATGGAAAVVLAIVIGWR